MTDFTTDWPDDADGGVFRNLTADGFDFTKSWSVDYNVDFEIWPPPAAALELLHSMYGDLGLYPPDEHGDGYVQFQVVGLLSYEGVASVQCRNATVRRGLPIMGSHALMLRPNNSFKPKPLRGSA